MKRDNDLVSASEIASWVWCPESWRPQSIGHEPGTVGPLEVGQRGHAETAAFEAQSGLVACLGDKGRDREACRPSLYLASGGLGHLAPR